MTVFSVYIAYSIHCQLQYIYDKSQCLWMIAGQKNRALKGCEPNPFNSLVPTNR